LRIGTDDAASLARFLEGRIGQYEAVLQELIRMGYLKYVPEGKQEVVKRQLLASLRQGFLEGDWDEDLVTSDRRGYPADNEELAEGRIGEFLLPMKEVFAQEGVQLESIEDDFQEDYYDVLVNGERFRVYGTPVGNSWAVSLRRFLEIVNELLQRAGSRERLFAIYGGNDGRAIFLTEEIHQYLGRLPCIDRGWMPYRPEDVDARA
jgi:hypothetical protein